MEHRYESDRSFREKAALELEKLSGMTLVEKADYIWTYYKPVFAALVALVIIIYAGMEIYENSKKINLLEVGVINSFVEDGAVGMEQELAQLLGTGDPYEEVNVDCTYTVGDTMENADPNIISKLMTIIMSGNMDILICNDFVADYYDQDTFMEDLSTLFTPEECEKYGIKPGDTSLDITHLPCYENYQLTRYENCRLIVVVGGKNRDNAVRFIKYLEEGKIDG